MTSLLCDFVFLFDRYNDLKQQETPHFYIGGSTQANRSIGCWSLVREGQLYVFISPFDHNDLHDRFNIGRYLVNKDLYPLPGLLSQYHQSFPTRFMRNMTRASSGQSLRCSMVHGGMYQLASQLLGSLNLWGVSESDYKGVSLIGFSLGGSIAYATSLLLNSKGIPAFAYCMGSFGVALGVEEAGRYGLNVGCISLQEQLIVDPVVFFGSCDNLPSLFINCHRDNLMESFPNKDATVHPFSYAVARHKNNFRAVKAFISQITDRAGVFDMLDQKPSTDGIPLQILIGWELLHTLDNYLSAIRSVATRNLPQQPQTTIKSPQPVRKTKHPVL